MARGVGTVLRSAKAQIDPIVGVQLYLVLLIGSPSVYVIGPLGAAGTPATLVGCALLMVWTILRLTKRAAPTPLTSIHLAVTVLAFVMLFTAASGMLRPISGQEVSSSIRGIITVASWCGVILFIADSPRVPGYLSLLTRTVSVAGGALAALGIIQFFTGIDYVELIHLPGLVQNSGSGGLYIRSGFTRVSGTALHSIEFAAVLSICLPIATHVALTGARRPSDWCPVILMFIALPLTVARSGAIGLVVGVATALLIASRRQRWYLLAGVPLVLIGMRSAVPGLLGTIQSLFVDSGEDQSVAGRVDDYAAAWHFIVQSPIVGRGPFTFLPGIYRVLDNQYLAMLIEGGLLGLLGLLVFFLAPVVSMLRVAAAAKSRTSQTIAIATAAAIMGAAVLSATFDIFGFPMAMGMLSVTIGLAAAIKGRTLRMPPARVHGHGSRTPLVALVAVVIGVVLPISAVLLHAAPVYEARGSVVVATTLAPGQNTYDQRTGSDPVPELVVYLMRTSELRSELRDMGVPEYEVALGSGSLAPYSDVAGPRDSEVVWLAARDSSPAAAARAVILVRDRLERLLADLQVERGVRGDVTEVLLQNAFATPEVFEVNIRRSVAIALGSATGLVLWVLVSLWRSPRWRLPRGTIVASSLQDDPIAARGPNIRSPSGL